MSLDKNIPINKSDKPIEKIDYYELYEELWSKVPEIVEDQFHWVWMSMLTELTDKLNQVIDKVNSLEKKE